MFGRRDFVRGVVATTTAAVPLVPQGAMAPLPPTTHTTNPRELTLPLRFDRRGGSYVLDWELNGRAFSGILDTASPFLTVSGSCGELDPRWGCLPGKFESEERKERRAFDPTYEVYGLQEDGLTDWLSSEVVLRGEGDASYRVSDVVFGASEGVGAKGGTAPAPMFGLVREVAEGIRPSFLSQTDFDGFTVDFDESRLRLGAPNPPDAQQREGTTIPLVDLRPLGAPAFEYASRVDRLVVNGYDVTMWLDRPCYCVFDTGTTGMLVSRRLWDSTLFEIGVQQCAMELPTVGGENVVLAASTRSCRNDCLLVSTPIDVEWRPPESEIGPGGPPQFDVIFVGLAFLRSRGYMSVDLNSSTMTIGPYRDLSRAARNEA